jgi:DUF971 family protein
MAETTPDFTPTELRVRDGGRVLRVSYDGGMTVDIAAEQLRAASPSVDQRRAPAGAGGVTIVDVEPVGNYAARFVFSDGHGAGIYSWTLLRALAASQKGPARDGA